MQHESDNGPPENYEDISQLGGVSPKLLMHGANQSNRLSRERDVEWMEINKRIQEKLREPFRAFTEADKRMQERLRESFRPLMEADKRMQERLRESFRPLTEADKRMQERLRESLHPLMEVNKLTKEKRLYAFRDGIQQIASLEKELNDARSRIESLQSQVKERETALREVIQERDCARDALLSLPKPAKSILMLDREVNHLLGNASAAVLLEGIHDAIDKQVLAVFSLLKKRLDEQLEALRKSVVRDVFQDASHQLSIEERHQAKLYDKIDSMIANNEPWSPGAAEPLV